MGNGSVTLEQITRDTLGAVLRLAVHDHQTQQVASNAVSIAQAHFEPKAWFRAICADGTPVGFVMLYLDRETHEYDVWRFMIDGRCQGRGYGRQALEQVIAFVRTLPGAKALELSYVPGDTEPAGFYRKLGFVDTGRMSDDGTEAVMSLDLSASP